MNSIAFLPELPKAAGNPMATERTARPNTGEDRGTTTLTELLRQPENDNAAVTVANAANTVDEMVRPVRFPGWQGSSAGADEVRTAMMTPGSGIDYATAGSCSNASMGTRGGTADG